MPTVRDQAFEVIDRLGRMQTESEMVAELKKAGEALEYDNFFMTGLPTSPHERLEQHAMISGWPDEWLSRYAEHGYVHIDPVIRKIRCSTMPFMWEEAPYEKDDAGACRVMNESPSFGLVVGMTVPIHTIHGFTAGVCFSSRHRLQWSKPSRAALHLISIYAHSRASEIINLRHGRAAGPLVQLSPREIECLKWSSAGKSAWDISGILGISQHTVEQHLKAAALKLGAVNKVQAVAEAMRRRAIP